MIFTVTPDMRYMKLSDEISDKEMKTLKKFFTRKAVNFFFDPRYKNGAWDGYDSFIHDGYIAIGLWRELRNFMVQHNYPVRIDGLERMFNLSLTQTEFDEFVSATLAGTSVTELRWFQSPCAYNILKYRYCMAELATSAGKTLISYLVAAYLKKTGQVDSDNKFLMIVPRSDLVGQTADKFETVYNNGTVPMKVARMGGKFNPHTKKAKAAIDEADVIIATYQTLSNCDESFFRRITHINVDEAHTTTNATIRAIFKRCGHLKHRFGLSGTIEINVDSADYCRLQEYLGPNVMVVSAKDLIDSDYSPDIFIKTIKLEYDEVGDETISNYIDLVNNGREMYVNSEEFGTALYALERQIITSHKVRLEFVVSFILQLKTNTLVLFNDVKGQYGATVMKRLKQTRKHVYYIDGQTKNDDRSEYTKFMELPNDITVLKFGDIQIIVNQYKLVKLSNGSMKYAKDILIEDDVSDDWINEYK